MDDFLSNYKGLTIDCNPQIAPDGMFIAHAFLTGKTGRSQIEATLSPPIEPFKEARDAADAALMAAQEWIDRHT